MWRHATALALVLSVLAGCGGSPAPSAPAAATNGGGQPIPVKVTQAVASSVAFLPMYVAEEKGFFKQQGLDVKVTATNGGGPDVQALIAGDADFTATASSFAFKAYEKGQQLLIVENMLNHSEIDVALSKEVADRLGITASTPLDTKLKDLKGLTFGVTRPGSLGDQIMQFLIRKAGYKPGTDVKTISISAGPAMLAALENGKVDGYVNGEPDPARAVAAGEGIVFISNTKGEVPEFKEYEQESILTRADYARDHPDIVKKFVAALVGAQQWIAKSSPEDIYAAVKDHLKGIDEKTLVSTFGEVKAAIPTDGKSTQAGIEAVERTSALEKPIPWDKVATNAYLPAS